MGNDEDFAIAFEMILEAQVDAIEARVLREAAEDNDRFATFVLKNLRRERYGADNSAHGTVMVNFQVNLNEVEDV